MGTWLECSGCKEYKFEVDDGYCHGCWDRRTEYINKLLAEIASLKEKLANEDRDESFTY